MDTLAAITDTASAIVDTSAVINLTSNPAILTTILVLLTLLISGITIYVIIKKKSSNTINNIKLLLQSIRKSLSDGIISSTELHQILSVVQYMISSTPNITEQEILTAIDQKVNQIKVLKSKALKPKKK